MKTQLNGIEVQVVSNDPTARLVFGTRSRCWYLVGTEDRDYGTGIPKRQFITQPEADSRVQYLSSPACV